jgi:hypothetical protein
LRHGVLLLPQPVALEFLDINSENADELLGFDAFTIFDENWIQPLLEFTLDLSDSPISNWQRTRSTLWRERYYKPRRPRHTLNLCLLISCVSVASCPALVLRTH